MRGFGDLEGAIMERVWSADRPLVVREIQRELTPERAYNTVWTVTEVLFRKGWLDREKEGRAYRYRATVSRDEYTGDLMGEALAASADRVAAFRRFAERISPDEAGQLSEALEQARTREARRPCRKPGLQLAARSASAPAAASLATDGAGVPLGGA